MTSLIALRSRVRLELGDNPEPFQNAASTDSVTQRFEIPAKPLAPSPVVSLIEISTGSILSQVEDVDYTVDYENGYVIYPAAPIAGFTLLVSGQRYRYFRDDDLDLFIDTALAQHFYNRTDNTGAQVTLETMPVVEEYPVAIGAVIEALWALYTDASFDIDIYAPDGVTIPRHQRSAQLLEAISNRRAQYTELCELLGVGLSRIEVFKTRRVSKATGRLIPIYMEREVEDNRYSRRVFLAQNAYGGGVEVQVPVLAKDLNAVANNTYSTQVVSLGDLTGLTVHASVRPYAEALSKLALFKVTIDDLVAGDVTLSLTAAQTFSLRRTAFWDLQTQDSAGNVVTLVRGTFDTERQGGF